MDKSRSKKFNIYCGMLMVAILFGMGIGSYVHIYSFWAGMKSGGNAVIEAKRHQDQPEKMEHLKRINNVTGIEIFPKDIMMRTGDSIVNTKTGEKMPLVTLHGMVMPEESKYHATRQRITMGMGFFVFALTIAFWTIFIRLIISVNKGRIFEKSMERRFAHCGWLVLGIYVSQWVAVLTDYFYNRKEFEFEAYNQLILETPESALLYSAFGMLLIGQICKIGRLLKEEQELTI